MKRLVAFCAMLFCSAALVGCSSGESNEQTDPTSFAKPGEASGPLDPAAGIPATMDKDKMKEKAPGARGPGENK